MNTMNTRSFIAALSAVFVLVGLFGCDKATKPKDVRYNLYVGATHIADTTGRDSSYNRIYIYDADSLTLLDSIWQAHFTENLAVSPDGHWLYVIDFTTQSVPSVLWKIDARTKKVAWSKSDLGGYLHFAADGRVLLAGNDVLQPEDGTLVRRISDSLFVRWGPVSDTKVAAIVRSSLTTPGYDSIVRVVDVATGEVSGRYVARLSAGVALEKIYTARLHPDGKRVLAIGIYGSAYNSWFVVGDVVTGQTLFQYRIGYPLGEMAISSDGSLAAVTGHGTTGFGEFAPTLVVDLRTLSAIMTTPSLPGSAQVCFLPGDRRVLTAPASDFWDAGPLRAFDLATMQLEKTIWPPGCNGPCGAIGVGPRP